jgi:beta-1,4-mannosyltransferase
MTMSNHSATIQVLMMPDYRADNPYQQLLADALLQENVCVQFSQGYRRIFPCFRATQDTTCNMDVLHLHWLNPYLKGSTWFVQLIYAIKVLVDLWLVRRTGVKLVWTVHNQVSHNTPYPRLEQWLQQRVLKLANGIVVHHKIASEIISKTYQVEQSKLAIIPHGHYRSIYREAIDSKTARERLALPITGKVYLHLGMLKPYKGIETLLQVWHDHHADFSEHTLLIAGKALDENYGVSLAQQAAAVSGVILQNQFIPNENIHLYFSAADVVVLPFSQILTSGSLILAMSFGKPTIAPDIGSIPETLGRANQLIYNPQTSNSLVSPLQKSLKIDLEELSRLVQQECDRLDWQPIAQQTRQLYLGML